MARKVGRTMSERYTASDEKTAKKKVVRKTKPPKRKSEVEE